LPTDDHYITQQANFLNSSSTGTFTWKLNGNVIEDANTTSIEISESGEYSVLVSNEYCASEIFTAFYIYNSVNSASNDEILLFPNPATEKCWTLVPSQIIGEILAVYDATGLLIENN